MNTLTITPPNRKDRDREARYRLSLDFVHLLEQVQIGTHGRRVALGLAHAICRETSDWHNGTAHQPDEGYLMPCKVLRERVGLDGAKGNRDLVKGLEDLQAVRLIERAELINGRQWLDWRLTDYTFACLFEPVPYGLFDIRHVPRLATPLDHLVYNRIGIIRKCRAPGVTLSVAGCAEFADRSPTWSRLRPDLFDALIRVAGHFDVTLTVICECLGLRTGIDHVTLRVSPARTTRSAASLGKRPGTARKVFIVDGDGSREIGSVANFR